jgi:hypothetical protein
MLATRIEIATKGFLPTRLAILLLATLPIVYNVAPIKIIIEASPIEIRNDSLKKDVK